jgi:transcriptional regulator with XRE-family HTH domain
MRKPAKMHVPDYFKRWRERNRLSIEETCERLRISPDHIAKIDSGKLVPGWVAIRVNMRLKYRAARAKSKSIGP